MVSGVWYLVTGDQTTRLPDYQTTRQQNTRHPVQNCSWSTSLYRTHVKYNDCTNYEGPQFLKVGQTATDDYYTLMHFDVSSIPLGSVITKARLKMRVDNAIGATPRPVRLYEIVGSWTASGVSWCNIPSKGHFLDEVSPPNAGAAIWEGDLMKLVQCWVDGLCPNDGVALAAPGNFTGAYRFYAVESGPPSHPKIQVEY